VEEAATEESPERCGRRETRCDVPPNPNSLPHRWRQIEP